MKVGIGEHGEMDPAALGERRPAAQTPKKYKRKPW